ncbi:MAG: DUF885 domain-containing protein [Candidatus Eremiobacteraeota bacterium]|nr:DUF885 domain-containing protein [Candidatus Eremiobacteraeota bacterium]
MIYPILTGMLLFSSPALAEPIGMPTRSTPDITSNTQRANALFDQAFDALIERRPMELTRLGSRKFYDRWDDLSAQELEARYQLNQAWASRLEKELGDLVLEPEAELSLKLFLYDAERRAASRDFAEYDYPVNQMFGMHAEIPAFLINNHQVNNRWEAEAYVTRLERLPALMDQLTEGLLRREKSGIMPPKFVFDYALSDISNLLQGYPLTSTGQHPVYVDFESKVKALGLPAVDEQELLSRGASALKNDFASAYRHLETVLKEQRSRADQTDGAWKFPRGDEYYAQALAQTTTTDMTADGIHELGLSEVERIHGEMREIMKKVGFDGTLQEFFEFMRTDPQFYYSNDEAGKKAYLDKAVVVVDDMKAELDELFITKPKADLVVKAVEPFREKSAGKAFYESPALDGSRPGIYYANLYDMASMPNYQMEALAYHEGIPGHHMQLSLAQEMESLPRFRRLSHYTAYIEGWGLYSEKIPKEYGFYKDPYSDFGRLAMELWRACRLVADTGIHAKKWNREKALEFYRTNTPNSLEDCQKMVDRHIVMPGQATAYKVGMNEILRLREKARAELGDRFDIREFHDVVLTHGAVPLAILEELVNDYVVGKLAE